MRTLYGACFGIREAGGDFGAALERTYRVSFA